MSSACDLGRALCFLYELIVGGEILTKPQEKRDDLLLGDSPLSDKTILITGSTDGIGLEAARMLVSEGHRVLLHGRNPSKLEDAEKTLSARPGGGRVERYVADLSAMTQVEALAEAVAEKHASLDVLINNAGVYRDGLG